jgi:hypothetical protein
MLPSLQSTSLGLRLGAEASKVSLIGKGKPAGSRTSRILEYQTFYKNNIKRSLIGEATSQVESHCLAEFLPFWGMDHLPWHAN